MSKSDSQKDILEKKDEGSPDRKSHHLSYAEKAQHTKGGFSGEHAFGGILSHQSLFDYNPLNAFPRPEDEVKGSFKKVKLNGKSLGMPLWISSMTGGTGEAGPINRSLAKVAGEYGLGLGLGSCRPLLESNDYFEDFNLRPLIGDEGILFANFGLAQLFTQWKRDKGQRIFDICASLQVDGLFIHLNPLQEWYQPEGDRWYENPVEILNSFCNEAQRKMPRLELGVKEVGQGMGLSALKALAELPFKVIEFGALGGTNFSLLESMRSPEKGLKNSENNTLSRPIELCTVGHSAGEMVRHVNSIRKDNANFQIDEKLVVISGGIRSFLDGYYLIENLEGPACYGMAKPFLVHAQHSTDELRHFVEGQKQGLLMAQSFLTAKPIQ